jgi:hypothetical protein
VCFGPFFFFCSISLRLISLSPSLH